MGPNGGRTSLAIWGRCPHIAEVSQIAPTPSYSARAIGVMLVPALEA